jgi:hypothetical protein
VREVGGRLELGHRIEPAVEREAATVIAAAQLLLVPGSVDDERAAMRAHVESACTRSCVSRVSKERLIEGARQQREGIELPSHAHDIVVRGLLPGAREHAAVLRAKKVSDPNTHERAACARGGYPDRSRIRIQVRSSVPMLSNAAIGHTPLAARY